jgi:rRNA maturation RNase YbeY
MNLNDCQEEHHEKPFEHSVFWPKDAANDYASERGTLSRCTHAFKARFDQPLCFSFVWLTPDAMARHQMSYRKKDRHTDVLTFPDQEMRDGVQVYMADILLARSVILSDAQEDAKPYEHHLAHVLFHGMLHALGYDHIESEDQKVMQAMENTLMADLNLPAPWVI